MSLRKKTKGKRKKKKVFPIEFNRFFVSSNKNANHLDRLDDVIDDFDSQINGERRMEGSNPFFAYATRVENAGYLRLSVISDNLIFQFPAVNNIIYDVFISFLSQEIVYNNILNRSIVRNIGMPKFGDSFAYDENGNFDVSYNRFYDFKQIQEVLNLTKNSPISLNGPVTFYNALPESSRYSYLFYYLENRLGEISDDAVIACHNFIADRIVYSRLNTRVNQFVNFQKIKRILNMLKNEFFHDIEEIPADISEDYLNVFLKRETIIPSLKQNTVPLQPFEDGLVKLFEPNIINLLDPNFYMRQNIENIHMYLYLSNYYRRDEFGQVKRVRRGLHTYYKTRYTFNEIETELKRDFVSSKQIEDLDEIVDFTRNSYRNSIDFDNDRFCGIYSYIPLSDWQASVPDLDINDISVYILFKLISLKLHVTSYNMKDFGFFFKFAYNTDYLFKQEPSRIEQRNLVSPVPDLDVEPENTVEGVLRRFNSLIEVGKQVKITTVGPISAKPVENDDDVDFVRSDLNYPSILLDFLNADYDECKNRTKYDAITNSMILNGYKKREYKAFKRRLPYFWLVSRKATIILFVKIYRTFFKQDMSLYGNFLYTYYYSRRTIMRRQVPFAVDRLADAQSVRWLTVVNKVLTKIVLTDVFVSPKMVGSATQPNDILERAFQTFWIVSKFEYENFVNKYSKKYYFVPIPTKERCLLRGLIFLDIVLNKSYDYLGNKKNISSYISRIRHGYCGNVNSSTKIVSKCRMKSSECYFHDKKIFFSQIKDAIKHFMIYHTRNVNIKKIKVFIVDLEKDTTNPNYKHMKVKKIYFNHRSGSGVSGRLLIIGGHVFPLFPKEVKQITGNPKMLTLINQTRLNFSTVALPFESKVENKKPIRYVSFDIETLNKNEFENGLTGILVPYAVGAEVISLNGENLEQPAIFLGENCFTDFLDWLGDKMIKYKRIKLFAHNGSKFDFYFLLSHVMKTDPNLFKHHWEITNPLFKSSRILSGNLFARKATATGHCKFADTFLYFPFSLRVLASIFGTRIQKSSFSYESITNFRDVRSKADEISKYLSKDVQALSGIIVAIKKYFLELYDINPYRKITAAGVAIGWFSRFMLSSNFTNNLYKISLTQHLTMKGAYFGGLVMPFHIGFFKHKTTNDILDSWIKKTKEEINICDSKIEELMSPTIIMHSSINKIKDLKTKKRELNIKIREFNRTKVTIPTIPESEFEGISAFDANSLYPSVMQANVYPAGKMSVEMDNFSDLNFIIEEGGMFIIDAFVHVEPNENIVPPFIKKLKSGNINPTGDFRTFILSPTYKYALFLKDKYGFKFSIEKIYISYIWWETVPLFRDAIRNLYSTKEEIDDKKDLIGEQIKNIVDENEKKKLKNEITILNGKRTIIKLLLNSIYGAFGIGIKSRSISIKKENVNASLVSDSWTDSLLVKNRNQIKDYSITEWESIILNDVRNLPYAAFTTSFAQVEFLKLANEVRFNKDLTLLYGDTDSIYALEKKKGAFQKLINETGRNKNAKLEGWKYDLGGSVVSDISVWAPKIKGFETELGQKITMKGIPMSSKFLTRKELFDSSINSKYIEYSNQYSDQWFVENEKDFFQVSYSDLKRIAVKEIAYLKFDIRQIFVGKSVFVNETGKIESKAISKKITFKMNKGDVNLNGKVIPKILNEKKE